VIRASLLRELQVLFRHQGAVLNPLAFMLLAVMLFAVAGPVEQSARLGYSGAVLWLIVLLTNLLSLDAMFRRDFDNGVIEQLIISAPAPFLAVLIRIFVQWLVSGLLITLLAPLICMLLAVPTEVVPTAMATLLLGTPALSLLGAIGAALTVGFSRGGILLGLLVLPLFLPVLIFGAGAINEATAGMTFTAQLYWLAFISMAALCIAPFATLAGLKISVQLQ